MTIGERIGKEKKKQLGMKEKLSDKALRELMNANASTYKRVKGRVRQK